MRQCKSSSVARRNSIAPALKLRQKRHHSQLSAVVKNTEALPQATSGIQTDRIINGCWQFAGGHGREVYEDVQQKLQAHAEAGFTTFDTADIYGPSERILGAFQQSWRDSGREPVKIFTKYVPNIYQGVPTPAAVQAALDKSRANLQVDVLDLVQLHWWDYGVRGMVDTGLALAELREKGVLREVATTNMNVEALAQLVDAGVPVVSNQVQFSLLDRRPLNGMLQYCEQQSIRLFAYGPVAGGLLSDRYVEKPKAGLFGQKKYSNVNLNTSSLKMYWNVAKYAGGQELWRQLLLTLRSIADKHACTVANVSLRWLMQQGSGETVCPIVGLRGVDHIADNAAALKLQLDAEDLAAIDAILQQSTGPNGDCYSFERGLPA